MHILLTAYELLSTWSLSALRSMSRYHHYWTKTMASSLLSNFDKECLRNVNARVFTNQMWTDGRRAKTDPKTSHEQSVFTRKTAPPLGGHFHDDWATHVTSRVFTMENAPPGTDCSHVFTIYIWGKKHCTLSAFFSPILTIFKLVRDINKTNILTKFHDDWAKLMTSRVFTRKLPRPLAAIFSTDRNYF
ncbi:hypothetical protein DPMN_148393 [Dreissena polymorpha]|uniref:Uncharacterized protein n=1 Tax=Dreissena polymorpha TaxID=45954 RepID=A0A9D4J1H3_DREPO|nr:hypothetical protein DPMN_148393 [Dreissena polymorpha]